MPVWKDHHSEGQRKSKANEADEKDFQPIEHQIKYTWWQRTAKITIESVDENEFLIETEQDTGK